MKLMRLQAGMIAFSLIASPASAQLSNNLASSAAVESRVQAGIVIPLGQGGSSAERAPRLEAWSEHRPLRDLPVPILRPSMDPAVLRQSRIGFSLGDQTRLLVNGRDVGQENGRMGISTLGWVGIGVGLAVLVGGAIASNGFNISPD